MSSSFKINLIIECTALTVDARVYLLFIKSGVQQTTRKHTPTVRHDEAHRDKDTDTDTREETAVRNTITMMDIVSI